MRLIFSKTTLFSRSVLIGKLNLEHVNYSNDELLYHAYEKWGTLLFSHLDGDFSFVFYDSVKKSYFAARDPLGIKALYYTKTEAGYSFSSNISTLLKLPDVLKKPNLTAMNTMLRDHTVDYEDTIYEWIHRLPPGYFMRVENGQEYFERYWYPEKIERDYKITEEEAAKKLYDLYEKAINKRISNIEEIAFQVSGGLDSSSVVSLLAKSITPSKIDSYSMDFKDLKCDESAYVDSILEKYPLHHQKIACERLDYDHKYALKHLYDISADWPKMWVSAILLPMVEKMTKDKKNIVLTGFGGDELWGWNRYLFYDLFRRYEFLKLYRKLKRVSKPWIVIKRYIIQPMLGEKLVHFIKSVLRKNEMNSFFTKGDEIKNISQIAGVTNLSCIDDIDAVTSAQHFTVMDANFTHPMEEYFGVEFRHPFYDLDLVEYSLSLPPEFKLSQAKSKWIFRKAMEGILPEKINTRNDKAEFSELLVQQIDALDLSALLVEPYIVKLGLIDQKTIDKVRKEYEEQTVKKPFRIWGIINMEYWYRYNFEKESLSKFL